MNDMLLLVILQLIYVPLMTLGVIMLVKGYKFKTFMLGFFETVVYICGVSVVLTGEQTVTKVFIYSLSYAVGLVIGMVLEEKMAVGHVMFNVVLKIDDFNELLVCLREKGFGATVYEGHGLEGKTVKIEILSKRSEAKNLLTLVNQYDNKAFIVSYEPLNFNGGFVK